MGEGCGGEDRKENRTTTFKTLKTNVNTSNNNTITNADVRSAQCMFHSMTQRTRSENRSLYSRPSVGEEPSTLIHRNFFERTVVMDWEREDMKKSCSNK
jgi:hypothetical protein